MNRATVLRWTYRIAIVLACGVAFFFLVFFPIAASFLITNSRFHFRERGPSTPEAVGLSVTPVEFMSQDNVPLRGWWSPGDDAMPVIIFVHGLNRSRLELLERQRGELDRQLAYYKTKDSRPAGPGNEDLVREIETPGRRLARVAMGWRRHGTVPGCGQPVSTSASRR